MALSLIACVFAADKKSGPARLVGQWAVPTQVSVIGTGVGMMRIIYPTGKCRAF